MIGDKAYDSDPLDAVLAEQGIEMIAPNRGVAERSRPGTAGPYVFTTVAGKWNAFAPGCKTSGTLTRHERKAASCLGFVQLGCIKILLRQYL